MDESAVAALCAVPPELQGGDAERFFDLIIEMHGNGQTSLDDLIPQVEQRDPGLVNPATQFSDNLRMQGLDGRWPDIAQMLVSEGGSGAGVAALRDQCAAAAASAGDGAGPDWGGFCVQHADFWAGWNGADWGTWRAAFACCVPAELAAESEGHLSYLDGLPPASQLAYLRDNLGFAINEQALAYYQNSAAAAAEAGSGGAEAGDGADPAKAWADFCVQHADFWAGWNGADWGTWRAAFAGRVPAELAAESERNLAVLDGLSAAGQLAYLRGTLSFTINEDALAYWANAAGEETANAAAAEAPGQAPSAEQEPTAQPDEADDLAEAEGDAEADVDEAEIKELADALTAELRQQGIDPAQIPAEELVKQLLETVPE